MALIRQLWDGILSMWVTNLNSFLQLQFLFSRNYKKTKIIITIPTVFKNPQIWPEHVDTTPFYSSHECYIERQPCLCIKVRQTLNPQVYIYTKDNHLQKSITAHLVLLFHFEGPVTFPEGIGNCKIIKMEHYSCVKTMGCFASLWQQLTTIGQIINFYVILIKIYVVYK